MTHFNKRVGFSVVNSGEFFTDGSLDDSKAVDAFKKFLSTNADKISQLKPASKVNITDIYEREDGETASEQIVRIFGEEQAPAVAKFLLSSTQHTNKDDFVSKLAEKDIGGIGGQFTKQFVDINKSNKKDADTLLVSKKGTNGGVMLNPIYRSDLRTLSPLK